MKKCCRVRGVLLSGRGVGLFRTAFSHINSSGKNQLWAQRHLHIDSLLVSTSRDSRYWFYCKFDATLNHGWEHAPNLTADVTIVGVVHGRGVLQYAFSSAEILKLKLKNYQNHLWQKIIRWCAETTGPITVKSEWNHWVSLFLFLWMLI